MDYDTYTYQAKFDYICMEELSLLTLMHKIGIKDVQKGDWMEK